MNDKAKELAKEHWEYIRAVLDTHGVDEEMIEAVKFHYITAFEHGWKHAKEDKP